MTSKMTISAICYGMYEKTREWEYEGRPGDLPKYMIDRPLFYHNVWAKSKIIQTNYNQFEFFVKEVLKLTSQVRIIRQRWKEMKSYGYLIEFNGSGSYALNLILVRPLFGEPNPEFDEDLTGDVPPNLTVEYLSKGPKAIKIA